MGTQVKLLDCTDGAEPCLLGRSIDELLQGLPDLTAQSTATVHAALAGEPIAYGTLADALSYLDPNCPRDKWLRYIGGIHAAPMPDDPDESQRRELAHRFSRGELDHLHRYDHTPPDLYTGPEAVDQAFNTMPPKAGGVGVGTIISAARKAGFTGSVASQSAEEIFTHFVRDDGPVAFRDVLARSVAPVAEIIPGLVEQGIPTFLCGPGGSCKSRLALQWGLCVAAGRKVYGRELLPATLVFLSSEDHADEVARRAQAITRRLELSQEPNAFFWDRVGKDSALALMREGGDFDLLPFRDTLRDYLRSIGGHKLMILDSCYDYVRFAGKAKIDEGAVNAFVKHVLQNLCDETNSTIIVIWHPSQSGLERDDSGGWSVAWVNAPRARLAIKPRKDTGDAFELSVKKRNHAARGQDLTLYYDNGALLPRSEAAAAEQGARMADACVEVAVLAAKQGSPIQKQRRLYPWMLEMIENAAGFRPSDREVKDTLARALSLSRLRYMQGTKYRTAGYYPWDMQEAAELAGNAKVRRTAAADEE